MVRPYALGILSIVLFVFQSCDALGSDSDGLCTSDQRDSSSTMIGASKGGAAGAAMLQIPTMVVSTAIARASQSTGSVSMLATSVPHPKPAGSKLGKVVDLSVSRLILYAAGFIVIVGSVVTLVGFWVLSRVEVLDVKHSVRNLHRSHRMQMIFEEDEEDLSFGKKQSMAFDREKTIVKMHEELKEVHENGLNIIIFSKMNLMLIFLPLGFLAHFLHWGDTAVFILNMLAMIPLAGLMGVATEELACHTGQSIGGLLNATFGNAVELIFVVQSLRKGLITVTKGTLLGSMLANELLVLGMALLFGGLFDKETGVFVRNKTQRFSQDSAMIQVQMLLFSSFMIVMPSMFGGPQSIDPIYVLHLSRCGAVFSLVGYAIFMVFQLYTHAQLLHEGENEHGDDDEEEEVSSISVAAAAGLLFGSTFCVAICSEFVVHGIDGFAHHMGFTKTFIGVILLPIIGNACEHSTAVLVALKDKVTLAIGISIGSTIQVALFVVPFAVIVGWGLDQPMDLNFHKVNSWAILLSSLLIMSVLVVGKSTWMNGVILLSAYGVLAFLYLIFPDSALD